MSDVVIRITAVDGASPVLRKIGDAATKAANELEKGGAKGKKGMEDVAKGARSADTQLRTFERTSLAVGAAMGAIALGLAKASAAYQTQERQLDALTRMYGDAARGAIDYAEQIQLTTKYSNDAARDSLVLLNTLTMNYGMQQDQIEALLSRSADLAQMHGKSLTEVTQMVSNALRGEGEYIEQIGVSMNQMFVASEAAARGMEDFIYGMTAAEQAAFRYTLLMEQTAAAQGYAMETATGTRGAIALVTNEFQDATQTFAGFLGPVRDVAAQFNSYALWLPLIASQVGRVGAVLVNAGRQFQAFNTATATMGAMAGPIGIGIAAVTAGLTYLGLKWAEERQAQAQAAAQAENTARSYEMLGDAITQMYLSGNADAANWAKSQVNAIQTFSQEWQRMAEMVKSGEPDEGPSGFLDLWGIEEKLVSGVLSLATGGWYAQRRKDQQEAREARRQFVEELQLTPEDEQDVAASFQRVMSLANNPYVDQAQLESDWNTFMTDLFAGVESGEILPHEINEEIDAFWSSYAEGAAEGVAIAEQAKADFERALDMRDLRMDGWTDSQIEGLETFEALTKLIYEYRDAVLAAGEANTTLGEGGIFNYMDGSGFSSLPDVSAITLTAQQMELVAMAQQDINEQLLTGEYNITAVNRAQADLNEAFLTGKINAQQYTDLTMALALGMEFYDSTAVAARSSTARLAAGMAEATEGVEKFDQTFARMAGGVAEAAYDIDDAAAKFKLLDDAVDERQRAGAEAFAERWKERQEAIEKFMESYRSTFGLDDELSSINMTSLASGASELAGEIAAANNELENMYRIIVGNTDAMKSQADSILSWAENLINVRGELGRIDELVEKGLITGQSGVFDDGSQYAQAQDAYDSIAASTERINDNLDAVQAIQAPIIAQSLEWQAGMTEQLLKQDAATQRVTLGWMDATSAAQAFQVVQQLALLQSGELGAQSEETMNTIVQGAIMANPLLFDMLESMGIISGTPVDFQINTDALAQGASELELLTTELMYLVDTLREINGLDAIVRVELQGEEELQGFLNDTDGLYGYNREVAVDVVPNWITMGGNFSGMYQGDPVEVPAVPVFTGGGGNPTGAYGGGGASIPPIEVPAVAKFGDEPMAGIPEPDPVEVPVTFTADSSQITAAAQVWAGTSFTGPLFYFQQDSAAVSAAALIWSGTTLTGPTFNFYPNAAGVEIKAGLVAGVTYSGPTFNFVADDSGVQSVISRYTDGAVIATQYVNIVARTSGSGILSERHGGSLHFATGGVVPFIAAENDNPEIAHFRNGGTALLEREGMYFAPPMTMISPSNTARDAGIGGETFVFNINVEGSVVREHEFKAGLMSDIKNMVQRRNAGIGV